MTIKVKVKAKPPRKSLSGEFEFSSSPFTKCYICKNIQKKNGHFICIWDGEEFDNFLRPEKCEGFEKKGKYNPSLRNSFEEKEF